MASLYRRGKVWWVRFQWRGQEIRRSARTSVKREAREYLERLLSEFRAIDTRGQPRKTFREAVMAYMEQHLPTLRVSTIRSYQQSLRVLVVAFGDNYLDEIRRGDVAEFEAQQLSRVGPAKVKHYRAALSGVFKMAMAREWVDRNPCQGQPAIKLPRWRQRFLSRAEWQKLQKALPEPIRSVATVAVLRGMRLGEILNLCWRDLDFRRDEIHIAETKTGQPRVIPMGEASAQFRAQQKRADFVFPTREGNKWREDDASRRFRRAADRAGFSDVRFHDLRHTFASWYVQDGGDLYRLQLILGHTGPAMTQRYAHLRTQDLRDPAQKPAQDAKDFLH